MAEQNTVLGRASSSRGEVRETFRRCRRYTR